jgi:hypothetical protein
MSATQVKRRISLGKVHVNYPQFPASSGELVENIFLEGVKQGEKNRRPRGSLGASAKPTDKRGPRVRSGV